MKLILRLLIVCLLALLAWGFSPLKTAFAAQVSVYGYITNPSGNGIRGIRVVVWDATGGYTVGAPTTNPSGYYYVDGLERTHIFNFGINKDEPPYYPKNSNYETLEVPNVSPPSSGPFEFSRTLNPVGGAPIPTPGAVPTSTPVPGCNLIARLQVQNCPALPQGYCSLVQTLSATLEDTVRGGGLINGGWVPATIYIDETYHWSGRNPVSIHSLYGQLSEGAHTIRAVYGGCQAEAYLTVTRPAPTPTPTPYCPYSQTSPLFWDTLRPGDPQTTNWGNFTEVPTGTGVSLGFGNNGASNPYSNTETGGFTTVMELSSDGNGYTSPLAPTLSGNPATGVVFYTNGSSTARFTLTAYVVDQYGRDLRRFGGCYGTGTITVLPCPYSSTEIYYKEENASSWQNSEQTLHYGESVVVGAVHDGNTMSSPANDVKFNISPAANGFPYYASLGQPTTPPRLLPPILPAGATAYTGGTGYTISAITIVNSKEVNTPACTDTATLNINPCPFTSSSVQLAEENNPTEWWDDDTGWTPVDGEASRPSSGESQRSGRYPYMKTHSQEEIYAKVKHRLPGGTVIDTSSNPNRLTNLIPGVALRNEIIVRGAKETGGILCDFSPVIRCTANDRLNCTVAFNWATACSLYNHGDWSIASDTVNQDDEYYAQSVLFINGNAVGMPECQDTNDYFYVDPCTYDSTQAYVRKYESQPWLEDLKMEIGEKFQVGAFHEQPSSENTPRSSPPFASDNLPYPPGEVDNAGDAWENFASLNIYGPYGFWLSSDQWASVPPAPIENGDFTDLRLSGGLDVNPGEYPFKVSTFYYFDPNKKAGREIISEYCADTATINVGVRTCPNTPPAQDPIDCCAPTVEKSNTIGDILNWLGGVLVSPFIKVGARDLKAPLSLTELADAFHSKVVGGQLVSYGTRQLLSRPDEVKNVAETARERKEYARWSVGLKSGGNEVNDINFGTISNLKAAKTGVAAVAAKLSRPPSGVLGIRTEKEEKVLGVASDEVCTDVVEEPVKEDLCFTESSGVQSTNITSIFQSIFGGSEGNLKFSTDFLDYFGRYLAGLDTVSSGGTADDEPFYDSGGIVKFVTRPGEPPQDYEDYYSGKGEGDFVISFKLPQGWPLPGLKIDLSAKKDALKFRYLGSAKKAFERIQKNLERPQPTGQ